jgi:hypothetical protein
MKGLMNDQIDDCENTPIFLAGENWLGFQPRLSFPSGQGTMPASGFQTVFSTTQSDQSIQHAAVRAITVLEILSSREMHQKMFLLCKEDED